MQMEHRDADGAPADFDALFRAHFPPMVRALSVACGDADVAADAVQEAFVKAYARWRRISRYDDPVGWVRHVALNGIRDHFRRASRGRVAVERLGARTEFTAPGPDLPDGTLALLADLPPQQRTALALFYVSDCSVAEIAGAMGISEGAVKYHLHAGRTALRPRVEET